MLAFFFSDWRIALTLSGFVALNKIFKTAIRCEVFEMPALCKVSRASLCFEFITMPNHYQKCNRVATIISMVMTDNIKITLTNQIHTNLEGDKDELPRIIDFARQLGNFYPKHIEKEDKHFFYPCQEYFDKDEQAKMLAEFWEFDRKMIHEKYNKVYDEYSGLSL